MKEKQTKKYAKINPKANVGNNRKNSFQIVPSKTATAKRTVQRRRGGCSGCSRRHR